MRFATLPKEIEIEDPWIKYHAKMIGVENNVVTVSPPKDIAQAEADRIAG